MLAEKSVYSTRQKRAIRSLRRSLVVAHTRSDRLLEILKERAQRKTRTLITSAAGALLLSLSEKLQDVSHYLDVSRPLVPVVVQTSIQTAVGNILSHIDQLDALSIFSLAAGESFVHSISDVTKRLLRASQDTAQLISDLGKKKKKPVHHSLERTEEQTRIHAFLDQIKNRGWRIAEKEDKDDEPCLYELGAKLIERAARPASELLPDDQLVGLVRFPIVINNGRIPKVIIAACTDPSVGYSMQQLFGRYLMVPDVFLMGIHRDTMLGGFSRHKFVDVIPQLILNNFPHSEILGTMQPIFPAKISGNHFYAPMLPKSILRTKFELGDWAILKERK